METFVIGLIIFIGLLAFFVILMAIAEPEQDRCNSDCKKDLEQKGAVCYKERPLSYLCKRESRTGTNVVFPWGSATMPEERNFVPNPIKVSIGINNTVTWTNMDSTPHRIVSEDVPFDSGVITTNQSWATVLDKTGVYSYQSDSYSWLEGTITVVPLDENYQKGNPITLTVFPIKGIEYMIFRESDTWGYISNLAIINENTVRIEFADNQDMIQNDFQVGDKFVGACLEGLNQIYFFTLERIETQDTPYVEFKSKTEKVDDLQCNFINFFDSE